MTRNYRGLWLSAAATMALFATGCGDTTTTDAGSGCTNDAACGANKACHPILKTCVASCTSGSDCPSNEKTCQKINNSTASFCTCGTDALCSNTTATAGFICNLAIGPQCTAKCPTAACPSGFTCNATSGQCAVAGSDAGTDAGTDAGVTDAGTACNNANQPDVCGYSNVCDGNNFCAPIVNGTCSNVAARPAWSAASTGPVIYRIDDEAVDEQSKCGNFPDGGIPTPFTVTLYAYAGTNPTVFPPQKDNLPGFFYYTTGGGRTDIPLNLLQQSNYSLFAGNSVMGAKFTVCGATGLSSIQTGFGFDNGNSACATLTH